MWARSVAFASLVSTELSQTLQLGRTEGGVSRAVLGAVGGSAAVLGASFVVPPLAGFLGLVGLGVYGWLLVAGAALAAYVFGDAAGRPALPRPGLRSLPIPARA
jgi:hypothetical protein